MKRTAGEAQREEDGMAPVGRGWPGGPVGALGEGGWAWEEREEESKGPAERGRKGL